MFFIILTTALTLNQVGITNISSSKEAAEALRPLAGNFSMILFTLGIITVGLLAIPTLAISAAYAFAETFNWKEGLDLKFKEASAFYAVIILAIICGILMDFFNFNPIKALFWSAVINGITAPFLLIGIFIVARDTKIMSNNTSSKLNQIMVALTIILMFIAAVAMLLI
jgi:Mn2+/Fe2+ NRAMP family transporter